MGRGAAILCRAAITLTLAMLLPAAPAAADTTINFDDLSPGTSVTSQYAGQGIVFGPLPANGGDTADSTRPIIESVPAGIAQSGGQVASIYCAGCELHQSTTTGTFDIPRTHVSVYVGLLGSAAPTCEQGSTADTCANVRLMAYDSNGNQIAASAPATVTQGAGVHTLLSLSTPSPTIAGFEIRTQELDRQVAIDDLSFDTPSKPPPPDFTLSTASTQVNVTQGASANEAVTIGRLSGSTGDISLSVSGLPPGVSAQFAPNPAGGGSSTLTLTASPTAPVTVGAHPSITITGTPQTRSAGSTAHTLQLNVAVLSAFDLHAAPASVSLSSCAASVTVDVSRDPSFAGPVSLSVTGLPGGVHASFNPAQITFPGGMPGQTSTLTITTAATGLTILRRTATIHASAPPFAERTATFSVGGTCPRLFQAQITSMQITQGTQLPFLPSRDPNFPGSPIPYSTIVHAAQPGTRQAAAHFRAGRWTVVRVYADLRSGPDQGIQVPMVLHGYAFNGLGQRVELPGSPILPTYAPGVLKVGPDQATTQDEGSDTAAYEFTLPSSWTHGQLEVLAEMMPTQSSQRPPIAVQGSARAAALPGQSPVYAPCVTADCLIGYSFGIRDIPFHDSVPIRIRPLALAVKNAALPDPDTVYKWARLESPLSLQVEPYDTTIDVSDLVGKTPHAALGTMNDRVGSYVCDNKDDMPPGYPVAGWVVGVAGNDILKSISNVVATWCWGFPESGTYRYAVVDSDAPAYSVPHELFHLLGRGHASAACGGADNDTFLNLGLAIPNHEDWPPDQVGYLQSVGLSALPFAGIGVAPYHVILGPPPAGDLTNCPSGKPPCPASATDWFDLMSYCGSRDFVGDPLIDGVWVSTHNWNAVFDPYTRNSADRPQRDSAPSRTDPGGRPSLYVTASIADDGAVAITGVTPVSAAAMAGPSSGYHLVGTDSAGRARADVTMVESSAHADGFPEQRTLAAVIPAAGVTAVQITGGAGVLASRRQSAHAPTVRLGPLPKAHGTTRVVRWRAADPDGDPLEVAISFSGDDGRTWKPIWLGPNRGRAVLPARYLFRARRARIRVVVGDGFQAATAVSRRFRSPGAPPAVSILLPGRGYHQPNDAPLVLSGEAFDDQSRMLGGRRLRWMLGRRLLGTGPQITVAGLPAGRRRIDLIATDSAGRQGRASLYVRLRAARPLFLSLAAPRTARRTVRTLSLRVASSLAATLTVRIAGLRAQHFTVGRRTRRVTLHIPRGRRSVRLRLSLRAGGLGRTVVLTVRRR